MDLNEIRIKYLEFFKERGHTIIPSSSLIPENDPSTLFISSGMQPLVLYLLGQPHPAGKRLVDLQKSIRTGDIEEVGDNRHLTFFEMFGNWSLGDYFKQEQLPWVFELLTKELGLDINRLYVTVFAGDESLGIPKDDESVEIWKRLYKEAGIEAKDIEIGSEANGYETGMQGGRIFYYDATKNWWSRAGTPEKMPAGEPGGPDSEVFYEFPYIEHDPKYGKFCHPNCDCGHFVEIGNSVFMEYIKNKDGSFAKLEQRNVDFGGGFERLAAAVNNTDDVYAVGSLADEIQMLEQWSGKKYSAAQYIKAFRVVADHIRAAVFLISDGARPSNVERGYVVRRLLRRAVRYSDVLGIPAGSLGTLIESVVSNYEQAYPTLRENIRHIVQTITDEETKFRQTLTKGLREFDKLSSRDISGEEAFILFSTYGFPLELTIELAQEQGRKVDAQGFQQEMEKHQKLSRSGSEQKFRGGLADTAEKTVRLHTAHHLLLKALQIVLGPQVKQRGSNITQERLRIDFAYDQKMTKEQIAKVEKIVNEKIAEDLPVIRTEMSKDEAEKLGAEHEFGQKYPDMVSVYSVGPIGEHFSIEFCGGPHVERTSELAGSRDPEDLSRGGPFRIVKEEAVAQGIRRIKAVLE